MHNLFSVEGKRVLITGSTQGLGLGMARGFVEAGALVIINGRNQDKVKQVRNELSAYGKVVGYAFDVTYQPQVKQCIDRIEQEVGPLDVLINNAGIHRRAPLEEMTVEDWTTVVEVNLNAVFYVSQCVAAHMIKRRRGKIINISSLNAEAARPSIANYCAAKGGIKMLTKAMATEWGRYNIQTNAIGPGYFLTALTQKLADDPEFDAWVRQEVPMGRWGRPEELIGTALYLSSAASDYVNGHTVYVDGGWRAAL